MFASAALSLVKASGTGIASVGWLACKFCLVLKIKRTRAVCYQCPGKRA